MIAVYRSTCLYVKSLHAKHFNTWSIGFEHKTSEKGLKLVASGLCPVELKWTKFHKTLAVKVAS